MQLKTVVNVSEEEFQVLQDFFWFTKNYCKSLECSSDCAFHDFCNVSPNHWDEDSFLSVIKMEEE